ncbi:hypothetical protein TeGR_g11360 [Tetraparma gracilis]|uniref:START domain-containing protein n=1 Tax=Tetraparma gracilis TaxID=2962635 RepID=A0ABQ6MMC8_9STRA|nr:hypothetical protein TeGR_g11360 [Tetraparma gracilis]
MVEELLKCDDQFHVFLSHDENMVSQQHMFVNGAWTRLPGTVREPVSYFKKVDEDSNTWGKAEGVVDASAPDVLAWLWHFCTHERNLQHERNGKLLRMELGVPGTRSKFMVSSQKMPGAISNRVFANWWTWAEEQNGDLVAAFTPHEDFGPGAEKQIVDAALETAKGSVLGKTRGFYRIKTLAPNVCRVTQVGRGDAGGSITKQAMAWAVKRSLGMVKKLQDKYMRNGVKVDAEMRGAFPTPPPRRSLTSEQDALVARCLRLEDGERRVKRSRSSGLMKLKSTIGADSAATRARAVKGSWVELKSTSPFVSLSMQYTEPEGGGSSVALGKAKATLDCSAKEALANYFAVCGREHMRICREVGDRARFVFMEHAKHDFEWALVKKMPFPLTNREFLGRYLSFKEPAGDLVLVSEALPDSTMVDYGANLRVVRAKTTGVLRFTPTNDDAQCEVTLVQHLDAGGFLPERVVVGKIPQALGGVGEMRELFQRDDAIDGAKISELAAIIKAKNENYTPAENAVVDRVRDQLDSIPDTSFEKIGSPDHLVEMGAFHKGGKNGTPRASTVFDEDICTCAAWTFQVMGRHFVKAFYADGGTERAVTAHNGHSFTGQQLMDFNIPTFSLREFVTRYVWRWESETVLLVASESCLAEQYPIRPGIVRGSAVTLEKFERLDPLGEIPQTRISFTRQPDMGGLIPSKAVRGAAVGQMMYLSNMRKRFDRSLELDGKKREELVEMIRRHGRDVSRDRVKYSEEEEKIVAEGKAWFKAFDGLKSKDVAMRSPQTKGKVAYKRGDSRAWGWSTATVRARHEEVLAHYWDVHRRSAEKKDTPEKTVETINDHHKVVYARKALKRPLADRDFVTNFIWKVEDGGFIIVSQDAASLKHPISKEVVRAKYPSVLRIVPINTNETKLEYVIHPDFGGGLPPAIFNRYLGVNLSRVTAIHEYFAQLRRMDDYDKADGRALGYRLTYPDEKNKKTPSEAVAHIVKLHKGLSQLSREYPWIVAFLEAAVHGHLSMAKAVSTKLDCVSEAEARQMGKSLSKALRARKTADAGVLQWKRQNPSMEELFEKYPWVEEMVETMGEELLKNAAWGLWFRVITGSGLSMVDLATDINVIRVYFEEGQKGYGWMMLGMVLASMGLQLVLVVVQNGKIGWGKLLREVLIVVSGLKPGVDAMRVVKNAEMHEHHLMDAKLELVFNKGVEMFCESIPGCILQVTALIQGGSGGKMGTKVLSIVVSALTTGMGSASISYDFDSDPEKRRKLPNFYGYLPDEGNKRTIMYVCMVLNSALLLLLRSIGVALLMLADTKIFVAYMAGDHLLYLLLKLVRGDFLYWLPVEGAVGLAVSLIMRVIVKTLTDFTGVIQLRAAGEMGGLMWLWTMCLALVAPWVAVPVYFGSLTSNSTNAKAVEPVLDSTDSTTDALDLDESDAWELERSDAWRLLGGLTAGWVFAFAVFLSLMKKKYRSTFWSRETGNAYIQALFLHGGSDDIKKNVFTKNKAKWKAIEPQVKEWVGEGWMGWERDKPEWFTDNWKLRVPADWVPKEGKAEHRNARERSVAESERKGSVLHASAKKLVKVMEGGRGGEGLERRDGGGERGGAEEEQAGAEAVRRGSRVQPVIR